MKTQNKVANVIGIIFAAILSILFVLMCVVVPVFMSLTSMVQPKQIVDVVQNIEVGKVIAENEEISASIADIDISADELSMYIDSAAGKKVLTAYANDISDLLAGKEVTEAGLTADLIKEAVNENIDELVSITASVSEEEVDTQALKEEITKTIDENAEEIAGALPAVGELEETINSDGGAIIRSVLAPTAAVTLIAIIVVIAGLIYLCRFRKFKALMWLGIDCGISGILLSVIALFIGGFIADLMTELLSVNASIADSIIKVYNGEIITALIIMLALCVLFIAGYILLKIYVVNKKEKLPIKEEPQQA